MQGTVLDGHALILQLSHNGKRAGGVDSRSSAAKAKADKKESSTKIIVRNVAFEATRKDLLQIFNPFGQVEFDHLHIVICNMLAWIFPLVKHSHGTNCLCHVFPLIIELK